jgi:hypothetical protein
MVRELFEGNQVTLPCCFTQLVLQGTLDTKNSRPKWHRVSRELGMK